MTTQRIIVGVDGSAASHSALRWAAGEAERRERALAVVSCYVSPAYYDGMGGTASAIGVADEAGRNGAASVVDQAVTEARGWAPTVEITSEVLFGAPATMLTDLAQPDDLVVVGRTGAGGGFFGSVTTAVVHHNRGVTVVVPADYRRPEHPLGSIVVGVDDSPRAIGAATWAAREAERSGARLVVVHAWHYPYVGIRTGVSEPRDDMQLDAAEVLTKVVKQLHGIGPSVHIEHSLPEQIPAEALVDASADADLLVVGSRGRGGLRTLLLGSVSRAVVQHSDCPVAVVRS